MLSDSFPDIEIAHTFASSTFLYVFVPSKFGLVVTLDFYRFIYSSFLGWSQSQMRHEMKLLVL